MAAVDWNASGIIERARAGAARGVVAATEDVRNEVLRLILQTPKTGRIYRRRSVEHQASAPGEAPASDTGRLVASVHTAYDLGALRGSVIVSTEYAAPLEYGTARMAARPYARPALANRRAEIEKTIAAAVTAALGAGIAP